MECYVLADASGMNPLFHGRLCPAAHQAFEDQTFLFGLVTDEFQSLVADRNDVFRFVFLCDDMYTFPSGRVVHYVFPT